jgi:hypothetical protein
LGECRDRSVSLPPTRPPLTPTEAHCRVLQTLPGLLDTRSQDDHWTRCRHPETAHNSVSSYDCTFDDLGLVHQSLRNWSRHARASRASMRRGPNWGAHSTLGRERFFRGRASRSRFNIRSSMRSADPIPTLCCALATRRSSRLPNARSKTCWSGCEGTIERRLMRSHRVACPGRRVSSPVRPNVTFRYAQAARPV